MKRLFSLIIVAILSLSLVGCNNNRIPIDECTWEFISAISENSVKSGYSVAESVNKMPEVPDKRVKYIACTMNAGDGSFSITDKTNGLTFGGTYSLQSSQPEATNYIITINEVEGLAVTGTTTYADGRETKTLIISISGYTLTFYEIN